MGAVDERFGQVELPSLMEISRYRAEDSIEHAFAFPLLKASMTRLVGRVPAWQVGPRRAGTQDPEDAVENVTRISPRPSPSRRRSLSFRAGNERLDRIPLLVRQVHQRRYKHLLRAMEIGFANVKRSRSLNRLRRL